MHGDTAASWLAADFGPLKRSETEDCIQLSQRKGRQGNATLSRAKLVKRLALKSAKSTIIEGYAG
jgi:hypothetical protein